MVTFLSKWAQNIIVSLIVTVLIELIMPEGNNKKYLKIVLGLYILSVVISPIMNNSISNVNIPNVFDNSYNYKAVETMSVNIDKTIEKVYIDKIEREIKKYIERNGFDVKKMDISIETADEERYGLLNKIEMTISEKENQNVKYVQEVVIKNTDGENMEKGKQITIFESFEEYLQNNYGVDKKNIIINTE